MPLGLGKSIITKGAAAAPGTTTPYWQSTSNVGTGNHAALLLSGTTSTMFSDWNKLFTVSFWFNASSSNLDTGSASRIIDWQGGISLDHNQFTVFLTSTGFTIYWIERFDGTFSYTVSPASFSTNYLNSAWHHVVFKLKVSSPIGKQFYLDGVSQTVNGTDTSSRTPQYGRYAAVGCDNNSNTSYSADDQYGGKLTQLFIDNIDIDLSANIAKFYNSGYVDLGTQGTTSGLARPRIFVYVDTGGTLQQGGANTNITLSTIKEGTGSITTSTTGGP